MKKSIKINAVLNVIRSSLAIIFPLITYPYVTRVLGVNNLGKINYAASIENYFALLAMLGVTTYAIREGSKVRDNKTNFETFANEIYTVNIVTTAISYVAMFICVLVSIKLHPYAMLITIQSISIIFTTIGVDWINTVYEDFLYITIRTIFAYILNIGLLFLFVRKETDYLIYAILIVFINITTAVTNRIYCKKYVHLKLVKCAHYMKHLKKMIVFFANNLAITIYVSADNTMLGWMLGDYSVGVYSIATKVYGIIKSVLAAIYAVTIPRLSQNSNNENSFNAIFNELVCTLTVIVFPIMAMLILLAKPIVLVLAGQEYIAATGALQILNIAMVFAIFGGAISNCYNIPLGREKINLKATTLSAIINILLNLYFIPHFSHYGAAITTGISELFIVVYCGVKDKKMIKYFFLNKMFIKTMLQTLVATIIMFILGYIIEGLGISILVKLFVSSAVCGITYLLVMVLLKNEFVLNVIRWILQKKAKKS